MVMTGMLVSGCFSPTGLLYTRVTQPLSLPSHRKDCPAALKRCHVSLTQLKEPVSRLSLSVMWSNNAVKEAAQEAGITEIYYADLETLSFVLGTYQRRRVFFYGD